MGNKNTVEDHVDRGLSKLVGGGTGHKALMPGVNGDKDCLEHKYPFTGTDVRTLEFGSEPMQLLL